VRHARASRATFYRCFEDKDACFVALAEEMLRATLVRVAQAVDPDAPPVTQVDQSIESFLAIMEEDHAVTVTLSNDLPALGERGSQLRADSIERYAELAYGLVHNPHVEAQMGPLRHVTIEKTYMLICGIEGLIGRAVRRDEDLRLLAPDVKGVVKRVLAPE
jgi:AcrR family transcriptional regulator